MFTGIIESIGRVKTVEKRSDHASLEVMAEIPGNDLKIGDSVAINGVCLTVTSRLGNTFLADIGLETLKVTTLGDLSAGDHVNVERPMQMGGRLGGHLVQGHVDGVGKISNINKFDKGVEVTLELSPKLSRYIIKRGSVAINGVSLTAADAGKDSFKIFLIPHTIEATTFKYIKAGDLVNLEVDIIGKYVEKLTHVDASEYYEHSNITGEFLRQNGF
ncbi:MAG: riboflavin synthase [Deltaproteobacteria bacterium CG11_big_fil_rev_8_21_14_0_20_49_13]|nr:MAG: riboflavin synthase [Deltaproteobacteria bacterium CG11_big_fil_rev_8_21_14_0_20_49_13]